MKMKKLLSFFMALVMLIGAVPFTVLTAFAEESKTEETQKADPGFVLYGDFKTKMSENAIAAIYVDGVLVYEDFTNVSGTNPTISIFKKAITEFAPSVKSGSKVMSEEKIAALPEVRVVLNRSLVGNLLYLDSIKGVKLTIDLNGYYLHQTTLTENGEAIKVTDYAHLTIVDSNPDVKWSIRSRNSKFSPFGGGLKVDYYYGGMIVGNYRGYAHQNSKITVDHSTVIMRGGTIAGFRSKESIIDLKNGSTLGLYHKAHVSFSTSEGNSVVQLSGKSTLTGDATSGIEYNYALSYGNVYSNGKGNTISGINVLSNNSSNVGGIYADNECTLKNLTVNGNSGYAIAGGIYLKKGGTVENCTVTNNSGTDGGGGIVVSSGTLSFNGSTVTDNRSRTTGCGVWVKPDAKVSVSGLLVIKNNENYNHGRCNLYIQGNNDLIPGSLKIGSEIWVQTGKDVSEYNGKDKTLTESGHTNRTGLSPAFFWTDVDGYYVDLISDTSHKNYRNLCIMKGTRPTYGDVKTLQAWEPVEVDKYTTASNAQYPLIKGYFEFNLMTTSEYYSASPFYYSDGYFAEDPAKYNEHLATMSINMAVAAFGRSTKDVGNNAYANHFANVKQLMADIGCADTDFYANQGYQMEPDFYGRSDQLSTIGVAMSQKKITVNGETYTLMPIAIRGGSYEVEWASNVTIGKKGEATGFADAANQVYAEVQGYLKSHGLESAAEQGKVKFWIVGYSRAGATANLTSKRLVDNYAAKGNQVFGYTFEAPMGGVPSAIVKAPHTGDGTYPTIHNTVNENDFVTLVAPEEMGFIRYGVDHLVGSEHNNKVPVSYKTDSTYWKRRQAMVAQLAAINPYYVFDDYWTAADINVYMGLGGSWNLTDPENTKNEDYTTMYKGLRAFFLRVQQYGLQTSDESKFREKYSTSTPIKGKSIPWYVIGKHYTSKDVTSKDYFFGKSDYSVQQGVQVLMKMMYKHPNMDKILETIMDNFNTRLNKKWKLTKAIWLYGYLEDWAHTGTRDYRPEQLNDLCHMMLDPLNDKDATVWSYMSPTEQKEFANALPIVIYFLLEYISDDYQGKTQSTLCTGSFVHNMDAIISNHYQEVSVAWVRSYDDYYANDLQAYRLDTTAVQDNEPKDSYATATNVMTLEAKPGSSIFYTTNGGVSWNLYTSPVAFESAPKEIKTFSIYRGVKSKEVTVDTNTWAGTLLGNGNVWFLVAGTVVMAAGAVVTAEVVRRRKKKATA